MNTQLCSNCDRIRFNDDKNCLVPVYDYLNIVIPLKCIDSKISYNENIDWIYDCAVSNKNPYNIVNSLAGIDLRTYVTETNTNDNNETETVEYIKYVSVLTLYDDLISNCSNNGYSIKEFLNTVNNNYLVKIDIINNLYGKCKYFSENEEVNS